MMLKKIESNNREEIRQFLLKSYEDQLSNYLARKELSIDPDETQAQVHAKDKAEKAVSSLSSEELKAREKELEEKDGKLKRVDERLLDNFLELYLFLKDKGFCDEIRTVDGDEKSELAYFVPASQASGSREAQPYRIEINQSAAPFGLFKTLNHEIIHSLDMYLQSELKKDLDGDKDNLPLNGDFLERDQDNEFSAKSIVSAKNSSDLSEILAGSKIRDALLKADRFEKMFSRGKTRSSPEEIESIRQTVFSKLNEEEKEIVTNLTQKVELLIESQSYSRLDSVREIIPRLYEDFLEHQLKHEEGLKVPESIAIEDRAIAVGNEPSIKNILQGFSEFLRQKTKIIDGDKSEDVKRILNGTCDILDKVVREINQKQEQGETPDKTVKFPIGKALFDQDQQQGKLC